MDNANTEILADKGGRMKTFTIEDIRSWELCYDPIKHLPEGWSGTVVDILKHDTIPPQDKLWVVCREDLIDAKTLRLFAVWCARQVEHLMTDERSKKALDVAERYANGEASDSELDAARAAAGDAWAAASDAWAAARAAARAARDARAAKAAAGDAWAAARAAARAARDARDARDARAAKAAAGDAWAAARTAARTAVRNARAAARDVASDVASDAQIAQLIKMVEEA